LTVAVDVRHRLGVEADAVGRRHVMLARYLVDELEQPPRLRPRELDLALPIPDPPKEAAARPGDLQQRQRQQEHEEQDRHEEEQPLADQEPFHRRAAQPEGQQEGEVEEEERPEEEAIAGPVHVPIPRRGLAWQASSRHTVGPCACPMFL